MFYESNESMSQRVMSHESNETHSQYSNNLVIRPKHSLKF